MQDLINNQVNNNNNEEKVIPVAVAGAGEKKERNKKEDCIRYTTEANRTLYRSWSFNKDADWTPWEEKVFNELETEHNRITRIIETLQLAPKQDEEMQEIKKQLEEEPVDNITIEFSYCGRFVIKDSTTKEIIIEDKAETVKSFLKAMNKMKTK